MSRSSHLLVSLFICLLLIASYFTPSSRSQGTLRSLSLNGMNQYLTAPSSTSLNITGAITVESWIKLNSIGAYQAVVSREAFQQAGTGGGYRLVVTDTGKLRLDLFQSHNTYTTAIGTTTITTGVWHHVAGVFDGSQLRVYVDGVLNGSVSTTNGPASGSGGFYIGRFSYSFNPYYFGGLIDEVRVSAAALYTSNFTPGSVAGSNVRGLWKFDGQTANDSSGNGNNGTLQNGATYSTDVPPVTNNAPSVSLIHPLHNTSFAAGSNIVINATASDSDGTVTKVDFYQGTTLLGTDTTAPYTFVWTNVPAGAYSLIAKATDDANATTTSNAVAVTVIAPGGYNSLSLNGTNQYLTAPSSTSLNITGAITVESWIKLNSIGAYQAVVSREAFQQAGTGGGYRLVVTDTGKLRLDLFQSHNTYTTAIGTTTITTGVWHHVAGVFDGSQLRVYVDGVLNGSVSTTNGPASGSGGFYIGRFSYSFNPYYFGGLIDEVRVSAAALYTSNFTPGSVAGSNVRGLWKFDGQTANDFSTNGNHVTLQNGATYSTDVPSMGGGSQPPVAVSGGPYSGQVNQSVSFTSSGSFDPNGSIASYHWNFGDSTSASTANPSHTYNAPGIYTATLTVTDNSGLLASATANVTINSGGNARLDPMNQTGGSGENALSRNFNWSLPIVSLPGRAGMDLGLSLSYNSLVWTKTGSNYISFDDDHGFPGPGFRLGFPVIQSLYFNSEVNKYAYLLIGADGGRTELRRVGVTTLFEAADSSYLLLDASTMILRTTDGTQLKYELKGSEFQCTEIKDRNGNYITVNYTSFGRIDTVLDTLGRSIKFNYDASGWLMSITQIWNQNSPSPVTHHWASFDYTNPTIQTSFTGLTVNGPSNTSTIKTLSKVTLADSSHYDFTYTSWGQVWKISSFAADNHLLNYRSYNLPQTATAQTDCPRFTERRDWAENWNQNVSGVEQEAITTYAEPASETSPLLGGGSLTGVRAQITGPDLTSTRIYFIDPAGTTSDWQRGLPALVNSYDSSGTLQRQVKTTWTQNNTSVSYPDNPRVTETNTYDPAGNRARVQLTYQQFTFANGTSCWLPRDTYQYAANATTILRSTRTDYHTSTAYNDRRIIGLATERRLYDGDVNSGGVLMTKIGFYYDNENGSTSIQGTDAPIQHDNTNYTASFVTGRGNMSSMRRYDVTNTAQFTTTRTKYNTAGAVLSASDALNHTTHVGYADSFSDGSDSRSTFAYPTTLTDPDNYTTSTKYNFDFGAMTYRRSPQPNTTQNQPGPEQTTTYDTIGRLQQVTNQVNGAYTRYVYPNTLTRVETYVTLQDGLGEAYSAKHTDGAGRVIATAITHPGSVGGYSGQKFVYDVMGRVIKTSNQTETSASGAPSQWVAAGDDAATGWIYSQQTYDWKGRPLVTTNQDGTTKTASYAGCGCAGGEVVTLTDEGSLSAGVAKRRQDKIYSDVLGRTVKTEVLNWNGAGQHGTGGTVYSTTTTTYNVSDQVTLVRQYAGVEGTGTYQDTTMAYDGYGRLQSKHVPDQNSNTATVWTYNADDSIQSVTDANGSKTTFAHNNRRMVTNVAWASPAPPGTPLPPPAPVTLMYDGAGNRISMTDGFGSVIYEYNPLSQITAETRTLTGVTNPNSADGKFKLTYDYNVAGQLKKFTDASNMTVNYSYDLSGRLNGVTGADTLVGGVTTYASGFQYGAAATLRQITTGNQTMTTAYNGRLQPLSFAINGTLVQQSYEYYADGRVSFVHNTTDNKFDRSYKYDHVGRLTTLDTGGEARQDFGDIPLTETFSYNEFDNLSARVNLSWSNYYSDSASYTNHRRSDWSYDADGRVTTIGTRTYNYDAGGQIISLTGQRWTPNGYVPTAINSGFDGDRNRISETANGTTTYFLRSTVFGTIVADLNNSGQKLTGYVFTPAGTLLANQTPSQNRVTFKLTTPVATSQYEHFVTDTTSGVGVRREFDPAGAIIPLVQHSFGHADTVGDLPGAGGGSSDSMFGSITSPGAGCAMDGVYVPCYMASRFLASGAAKVCPNNDCSPRRIDIDIRYKGGATQLISGLTSDPFAIPDGFDHTWRGDSAQAAARAFNLGVANRTFGTGAVWAIIAGNAVENLENASPAERARFGLAFNDMLKRLETPACAQALGGLTSIFDAIGETTFRFRNMGGPYLLNPLGWQEPDTFARTDGNTVSINSYGRFMAVNGRLQFPYMNFAYVRLGPTFVGVPDSSNFAPKQIEGGDIGVASFVLTHEVGHRTGRFPADVYGSQSGVSAQTYILQARNNARIYTSCGFGK